MRPDGDPERDDYGLPRVDVVIPDDARELERDIIAYRREERQRRRRARLRRFSRPFGRYGVAVPLIAGALLVAMVSGTLMTVFGPHATPRPSTSPIARSPSARPGQIGGMLPDTSVTISGRAQPLLSVRPGMIGIVPPDCGCQAAIAELAKQAQQHQLKFWLAADRRQTKDSPQQTLKDLQALAGEVHEGLPVVVDDRQGTLAATYAPSPTPQDKGFTLILVYADGVVADVIHNTRPDQQLTGRLDALALPSPGKPA